MGRTGVALAAALLAATPAVAQTARPFGTRTLTPRMLACADQPTATRPAASLHVRAAQTSDHRAAYAAGDILIIDAGAGSGLEPGQRFFVRRFRAPTGHADWNPAHAGALRTTGWVTITAVDQETALARVDSACTMIEPGDFLTPYEPPALPPALGPDGDPRFDEMGRVLFGTDRRLAFSTGDLLSVDRGEDGGFHAGTRIAFFRDRENGTPLVQVGEGVVLATTPATSTVVVTALRDAIEAGDFAAPRGPRR
ncbi:MAG: hypothetical protein AB7O67_13865 [Vicinamibacterales bacterium]